MRKGFSHFTTETKQNWHSGRQGYRARGVKAALERQWEWELCGGRRQHQVGEDIELLLGLITLDLVFQRATACQLHGRTEFQAVARRAFASRMNTADWIGTSLPFIQNFRVGLC
jgi:hypothetical protein